VCVCVETIKWSACCCQKRTIFLYFGKFDI
jgi:hypothetical protein